MSSGGDRRFRGRDSLAPAMLRWNAKSSGLSGGSETGVSSNLPVTSLEHLGGSHKLRNVISGLAGAGKSLDDQIAFEWKAQRQVRAHIFHDPPSLQHQLRGETIDIGSGVVCVHSLGMPHCGGKSR